MATQINAGTAEGLLEFLDYLIDRGYGGASAITPLKSAVNQVFSKVEGDEYGDFDVRSMDVDEFLDRFATKARADYKQESIAAYRTRFRRAIDYYRAFLEDGSVPQFTGRRRRAKAENGAGQKSPGEKASAGTRGRGGSTPPRVEGTALVDYPFPLASGQLAYVRLPKRFEKADAERMGAFLLALAFDSPAGEGND